MDGVFRLFGTPFRSCCDGGLRGRFFLELFGTVIFNLLGRLFRAVATVVLELLGHLVGASETVIFKLFGMVIFGAGTSC